MDNHAFRAVNEVARRFPGTIPRLNRFASAVASQRERVDWSYRIFASDRLVRFEEMEYACRASTRSRRSARARAALERHPVSFPIELRFSAADDALLSPAHGRDSAFVAVHVFRGMAYEPAFREVEAALSRARRAPALGQALVPDRGRARARATRAGTTSRRIRAALDPGGRFANAWVRDVLG